MDYYSSSTAPTAPPPEATVFEYPVTATGIVLNDNNNTNNNVQLPSVTISTSNSPGTINARAHSPIPWSTGLCGCFQDIHTCCLTCWCPCITFGRIAEIVDRGSTSCGVSGALYMLIMCVTGCSCLYSCFYRSKLRGQYFLEETPCTDCCIHCCCEECALCQEYRELKNQGFDMSIGWHGNVQRQNRLAAPTMQPGMNRSA